MGVQLTQDLNFVGKIRAKTDEVLRLVGEVQQLESSWTCQYGGGGRLGPACFAEGTPHEGLSQGDIASAVGILTDLAEWLDEAGQNRRGYLEKVRP